MNTNDDDEMNSEEDGDDDEMNSEEEEEGVTSGSGREYKREQTKGTHYLYNREGEI